MKKRLRILIPIAIAIVILAIAVWNGLLKPRIGQGELQLSGNIDITQVDMAFKVTGRLHERLVDEGDPVSRNQRLAILDDTDLALQLKKVQADAGYAAAVLAELEAGSRPEEIQAAKARVGQARSHLEDLLKGSRNQEIAEAMADVQRAKADERTANSQLVLAQADFKRYASVFKTGGVSRQDYDTQRTRRDAAQNAFSAAVSRRKAAEERLSLRKAGSRENQIRQARSALAQTQADLDLVVAGPRKEAIYQARERKAAADAGVALARQQLADTQLFAPFDGVVLSTSAEPGSYLYPGTPVLTIGDLKNVWLRAFVAEADLGRIRLGQTALVTVDAYPDRTWKGRVSFISSAAEFTPRSVQTFKERTNLVYRIKIQLDNPDGVLKPGMPADARVEAAP
ncbi:Secretion protein HlyD family protein [Desulfosarcina cetonica]|uniref:efflux RND transporter periplasmic adaptor subunit n=1 Tax=Desulfosarcina cetonica TaxID=90730 RepID=UPI0006D2034F|nr:efflux RND transporter periplasmic adaptor subunit [Desulfosarcina cetonica]VTR70763.1 Secretion protein HlyD family protein [Desulfosarcina cetonica]